MNAVVGGLTIFLAAASAAGTLVARSVRLEGPPGVSTVRPAETMGLMDTEARLRARAALFAELQPVKLRNCELARFGESHDGGYLICANLLGEVGSAYSFGISGYDGWGCAVSSRLKVPVHQYDCFNTTRPSCPTGQPIFHAECVAGGHQVDAAGRLFDSLQNQFAKNGDAGRRLVVKMDVEGAEWESILETPDEVLDRIDQFVFEFHGVDRRASLYLEVIGKLKRQFEIAHLHFNNHSCIPDGAPFPAWAYEVTFVNKRLAEVDPSAKVALPDALDAPNLPTAPDCQTMALLE